jgi:phosphatidate cytidylyltransferase
MVKRVISGLMLAAVAIAAIWAGGLVFDIVLAFFAVVATCEIMKAFKNKGHSPIWGSVIIMLLVALAPVVTDNIAPGVIRFGFLLNLNFSGIIVAAAIIYALAAIVIRHEKYTVVDAAITIFGCFYVIFLFNFFITLRNLEAGAYMVILAILGCVGADTAAFVIGCKFGKKKLIPKVSPNKTVEGSIAAFGGSVLVCTAYGIALMFMERFPQFPIYHYVIIGLLLGAVAQIGDLCASAVKRYCGVKDFGKIIPGHGGILDRFDAYLLAMPVVYYYYVVFLYLWR